MNNPLVSIIINNYNYELYLKSAIESALSQNYENVEIIVVDDGSNDSSCEIIKKFGSRIYPIFKKNEGQGSAYNIGFNESQGTIIIFLDADDRLKPHALTTIVSSWQSDISRFHFNLSLIDQCGKYLGSYMVEKLPTGDIRDQIKKGINISVPGTGNAFARSALSKIMPMPETLWRHAADTYPLWLTPFFGKVITCKERLGEYRVHLCGLGKREMDFSKSRFLNEIKLLYLIDDSLTFFFKNEFFGFQNGWLCHAPQGLRWRISALVMTGKSIEGFTDTLTNLCFQVILKNLLLSRTHFWGGIIKALWFFLIYLLPKGGKRELVRLSLGRRSPRYLLRRLLRRGIR